MKEELENLKTLSINSNFLYTCKQCYFIFQCKTKTESKNQNVVKIKNGRIMLLPKCAVCDGEKSRFIKEKEASGLLSSL